jgi:hypothetical protein
MLICSELMYLNLVGNLYDLMYFVYYMYIIIVYSKT